MKKITVITAVFTLLLFAGGSLALAGDSVGIAVSCTVPAVPGFNAPYLEQQIASADISPRAQTQQEYEQGRETPLLEEETKDEDVTTENEKDIVLVKTFYVR